MGSHAIAVVAGEEDEGILVQAAVAQSLQQATDLRIRLLDEAVVGMEVVPPLPCIPIGGVGAPLAIGTLAALADEFGFLGVGCANWAAAAASPGRPLGPPDDC